MYKRQILTKWKTTRTPRGRLEAPPPWVAPKAPPCCLQFGKDFLCFGLISGAHPEAFPPSFFGTVHLPCFSQRCQGTSGDEVASLRAQGALGAFGPLKKVASLRDPCPENQGRWTVPKKEGGKASGWAPEIRPKHRKSLPNGRQQGGAFGAAPRGRHFAPPPWGSCCLPFGKDFLCFGLISGAHPESFPLSFFWDFFNSHSYDPHTS